MVTIATVHSQKIHLKTQLPRAVFQFWIVTFTTPVHRLVLENWFGTAAIHFWVTWQLCLLHHLNWPRYCHKIWYCMHCSRKKKKAIRCSFKNQIQRIRMSFLILNDFQFCVTGSLLSAETCVTTIPRRRGQPINVIAGWLVSPFPGQFHSLHL